MFKYHVQLYNGDYEEHASTPFYDEWERIIERYIDRDDCYVSFYGNKCTIEIAEYDSENSMFR